MPLIACPSCGEVIEIQPPDKVHSAVSLGRPIGQLKDDMIIEKIKCIRQGCKAITIYWYPSAEYASVIW